MGYTDVMGPSSPRRLLAISIWGSVALTVGVCSFGIRLTMRQYQDTQGILLDAERRATTPHRAALESHLQTLEDRALARLAGSSGTPRDLEAVQHEFPIFRVPFFIFEDGRISAPSLRPATSGRTWADDEPPPIVYLNAVRKVHSQGDLAGKRIALQSVHERDELAPRWRVRALTQLAAAYRREKQPREAARTYERIFADFHAILPTRAGPTLRPRGRGAAETSGDLTEGDRATTAIRRGLEHLSIPERATTLSEEEFFLRHCRALIERPDLAITDDVAGAVRRAEVALSAERMSHSALESARDLIRSTSAPNGVDDGSHLLATRFRNRLIPVVWRNVRAGAAARTHRTVAVGFLIDPPPLIAELGRWLDSNVPDADLRVFSTDAPGPEVVPLLPLSGDLGFATLGKDARSWEDTLGGARRPFILAAVLIGGLGLILIVGLLFLHRSVRREMLLARMKTEFVANVSHELKTPLALIRLCSETLELDRLRDQDQRKNYYEIITRESERLTHLIGNVLNFASIEAGKKTYTLAPRDLAPLLEETSEAYFLKFRDRGFECSHDIPSELPRVLADEEAVAQALINLMQNAVRYSDAEKSVVVRATTDGSSVRISVQDRGIGISPEDRTRIWEDYYRTGSARALGTRGSGLGLSLVKHILQAHGGDVELVSRLGEGSEFTLILPVTGDTITEVHDEVEDPRHRG